MMLLPGFMKVDWSRHMTALSYKVKKVGKTLQIV
jgi:hypothetical protein